MALAISELGYDVEFGSHPSYRAEFTKPVPTTLSPVSSPIPPEEGEHRHAPSLFISSRGYIRERTSIILTLPSPYVLPRFSLLKRIFREPHAQSLLSSVWDWSYLHNLYQFSPTAIAFMTGYFLQVTKRSIYPSFDLIFLSENSRTYP